MGLKVAMLQTGYAAWPDKDVLDRDYRVRLKPPTLTPVIVHETFWKFSQPWSF